MAQFEAALAKAISRTSAVLLFACCQLGFRHVDCLGARTRSQSRIVDLDSTMNVPEHVLFTFGFEQDPSARKTKNDHAVWVILYQTNMSLAPLGSFYYSQLAEEMGGWMQPEVLGQGTEWSGFSTKHNLALQRMKDMNPDDLVILSDFGDVVLNPGKGNRGEAIGAFKEAFHEIVGNAPQGSVVVSAEAQCCVAALSYHVPGALVNADWQRERRACNSGAPNCLGTADPGSRQWENFMEKLAHERGYHGTKYPYLNAGLIAGKARDLIRVLTALQLEAEEDDQAVMTDLLYRNPASFVLDYDQRLFGNARWAMSDGQGCVFDWDNQTAQFTQKETRTRPLFLHTSGHFFSCLRSVAGRLGWQSPSYAVPSGARQGRCLSTLAWLAAGAAVWWPAV